MIIIYQIRQQNSFSSSFCSSHWNCARDSFFLCDLITGRKLLPKGHNIYFSLLGYCSLKNYAGALVMFRLGCRRTFMHCASLLIAPGVLCTCVNKRPHTDGFILAWLEDL